MSEKTIATVRKNAREEIRVSLSEYRGHNLAALRVWVDSDRSPERVPTPKGVTFNVVLLPALRAALDAAEREARAAGLLADG